MEDMHLFNIFDTPQIKFHDNGAVWSGPMGSVDGKAINHSIQTRCISTILDTKISTRAVLALSRYGRYEALYKCRARSVTGTHQAAGADYVGPLSRSKQSAQATSASRPFFGGTGGVRLAELSGSTIGSRVGATGNWICAYSSNARRDACTHVVSGVVRSYGACLSRIYLRLATPVLAISQGTASLAGATGGRGICARSSTAHQATSAGCVGPLSLVFQ